MFGYYALYCSLVVIYLISKVSGTHLHKFISNREFADFNWLIQIGFYGCYYIFGIYFLSINTSYPRFTAWIKKYVYGLLFISIAIVVYGFIVNGTFLGFFYAYIFIPTHIIIAIAIMVMALRKKNPYTYYFLFGSALYIIFAVLAFFGNAIPQLKPLGINSLVWFFVAIILESSIFSYAMGLMIYNVYKQQMKTSVELSNALKIIEQQIIDEKKVQENERKLLQNQIVQEQLTSKVSYLQNRILLEQINAHFIFNVLNSIKVFVAENQSEKAIFYLNQFAKFIRNVLDGSRSNQITLSEEIKNMETYLSIEKMRFEEKFDYSFEIEESVSTDKISIPTFLLQPFIENALWHGIMPANKNGKLVIKIYALERKTIIEIDDNGLGINKSKERKTNSPHQSVGLNIVKEIIENYNHKQEQTISFQLFDKTETYNEMGTKVIISIDMYPELN